MLAVPELSLLDDDDDDVDVVELWLWFWWWLLVVAIVVRVVRDPDVDAEGVADILAEPPPVSWFKFDDDDVSVADAVLCRL